MAEWYVTLHLTQEGGTSRLSQVQWDALSTRFEVVAHSGGVPTEFTATEIVDSEDRPSAEDKSRSQAAKIFADLSLDGWSVRVMNTEVKE